MAQYRTDGIVLKRLDFGEADRILTIFTQKRGKLTALAKGVRRMESRKAGNVELLNWTTFFLAEGKSLDVVTEVQTKETFQAIKEDLIRAGYAYHLLELLDRLLPERQPHADIFGLTIQILALLVHAPRQVLIRAYEVKLLKALGFWSLSQADTLDAAVLKLLERLEREDWDEILLVQLSAHQARALEQVLQGYLERVLEGTLRSQKFLRRIKNV